AASSATWNVNTNQIASGRIGFALALPSGTNFLSGLYELLKVKFGAASPASGNVSIGFGDQVILREVSDPSATALATVYAGGTLSVNPQPSLRIALSNQTVMLAWPAWATNYVLQQIEGSLVSVGWTGVSGTPGTTNGESVISLPMDSSSKYYRLLKQ